MSKRTNPASIIWKPEDKNDNKKHTVHWQTSKDSLFFVVIFVCWFVCLFPFSLKILDWAWNTNLLTYYLKIHKENKHHVHLLLRMSTPGRQHQTHGLLLCEFLTCSASRRSWNQRQRGHDSHQNTERAWIISKHREGMNHTETERAWITAKLCLLKRC